MPDGEENMSNAENDPYNQFRFGAQIDTPGALIQDPGEPVGTSLNAQIEQPTSQDKIPDIKMQDEPPLGDRRVDPEPNRYLPLAFQMREQDYRNPYQIFGKELIVEINRAGEKGDIKSMIFHSLRAVAVIEGLDHGIYAETQEINNETFMSHQEKVAKWKAEEVQEEGESDTEYKNRIIKTRKERRLNESRQKGALAAWEGKLLKINDSTARENIAYLRDAIKNNLTEPVRWYEIWDKDGGKVRWREYTKAELEDALRVEEWNRLIGTKGNGEELTKDKVEKYEKQVEEVVAKNKNRIELKLNKEQERMEKRIEMIKKNKNELVPLSDHIESRIDVDTYFRHRMMTAYDRNIQGDLRRSVGLGIVELDGIDMYSFYQYDRAWGEAVDRVQRRINQAARGDIIELSDLNKVEQTAIYSYRRVLKGETFKESNREIREYNIELEKEQKLYISLTDKEKKQYEELIKDGSRLEALDLDARTTAMVFANTMTGPKFSILFHEMLKASYVYDPETDSESSLPEDLEKYESYILNSDNWQKPALGNDSKNWRLDTLWAGWRRELEDETPGKYSMTVIKDKDGSYKINFGGISTVNGDLGPTLSKFNASCAKEYGWSAEALLAAIHDPNWDGTDKYTITLKNGQEIEKTMTKLRVQKAKNFSHTVHPRFLGQIVRTPGLSEPLDKDFDDVRKVFLEHMDTADVWGNAQVGNVRDFATIEYLENGRVVKKSVWDMWKKPGEYVDDWGNRIKVKHGLSFANPLFKWFNTETGTAAPGEPATGMYGFWHLMRGGARALNVRDMICGMRKLQEMGTVGVYTEDRAAMKLGFIKPQETVPRGTKRFQNPWANKVAADLAWFTKTSYNTELNAYTLHSHEEVGKGTAGHKPDHGEPFNGRTYLESKVFQGVISNAESHAIGLDLNIQNI
jgi:hypothetical protein